MRPRFHLNSSSIPVLQGDTGVVPSCSSLVSEDESSHEEPATPLVSVPAPTTAVSSLMASDDLLLRVAETVRLLESVKMRSPSSDKTSRQAASIKPIGKLQDGKFISAHSSPADTRDDTLHLMTFEVV